MLRDEQQTSRSTPQTRVIGGQNPVAQPTVALACEGSEPGDLRRVRADPVDPRVADLGGDHRQRRADRAHDGRHVVERRCHDFGSREPGRQRLEGRGDLCRRPRPQVVTGHVDCDGDAGAGHHLHVAVAARLIHDRDLHLGGVVAPHELQGNLRRRGDRVDADVQQLDPGVDEQRNERTRVARDVGHLRRQGPLTEPTVQLRRQRQSVLDQRAVGELSVQREGHRVPAQLTPGDRVLDPPPTRPIGRFQRLGQDPRPGRPAQACPAASSTELGGRGDRAGEEVVEVAAPNAGSGVGEPDVEVGLGDEQDPLHIRFRRLAHTARVPTRRSPAGRPSTTRVLDH